MWWLKPQLSLCSVFVLFLLAAHCLLVKHAIGLTICGGMVQ
jgi:hypothetical protein